MITFHAIPPLKFVILGYLPGFFDVQDPLPAAQQLNRNYAHGGGWRPLDGWVFDPVTRRIQYPGGDPALDALAVARLRDETLLFFPHEWLCIVQKDGSYEVSRVD